ncbi:hypothetical protein E0H54_27750 [Rhizobium leguminosarum bv. viciae]|nr:hypothetical protein E0H54_27750 [Rhizobium leguminosarum bv. viciae]
MKQIGEVYQPKSAKGNARKREINIVAQCPVRTKAGFSLQIHGAECNLHHDVTPTAGCGFWRTSGGNASAIAAAPRPTIAEPMNSQE